MVKLHDKQFEKFIGNDAINHAINGIAVKLNDELKDKRPVFLTVLNGAFLFSAEIIKRFNYECELSFIKVASYEGMQQGEITTVMGAEPSLKGRTVVVVEDIVDSGNTIEAIMQILDKL
jgi:adenylate kinase